MGDWDDAVEMGFEDHLGNLNDRYVVVK